MMMRLDATTDIDLEVGQEKCRALRESLHSRSDDMSEKFDEVQAWYKENVKPREMAETDLAKYLNQYLVQVSTLLNLISACRSRN